MQGKSNEESNTIPINQKKRDEQIQQTKRKIERSTLNSLFGFPEPNAVKQQPKQLQQEIQKLYKQGKIVQIIQNNKTHKIIMQQLLTPKINTFQHLIIMKLQMNNILSVEFLTLFNLQNLEYLDLGDNKISCMKSLRKNNFIHLKYLNLQNNLLGQFNYFSQFSFESQQIINLYFVSLRSTNTHRYILAKLQNNFRANWKQKQSIFDKLFGAPKEILTQQLFRVLYKKNMKDTKQSQIKINISKQNEINIQLTDKLYK